MQINNKYYESLHNIHVFIYRFREVISGFVTQSQFLLRKQVLTRLNDLMFLQGELSTMLSLCDSKYQPSPCYFHYFPPPLFLKVEKTIKKKGKRKSLDKNVNTCGQESWEIGSILCSKNPAYFRKLDAKVFPYICFSLYNITILKRKILLY